MSDVALHRLGGEGPDILLIHGFGADRLGWLAVTPHLFGEASVWAVEYAGHGTAGNDAGDGALATIAAAIADEIGDRLTRPLVVGHSLGGTLALHLAAARMRSWHHPIRRFRICSLSMALAICRISRLPPMFRRNQTRARDHGVNIIGLLDPYFGWS